MSSSCRLPPSRTFGITIRTGFSPFRCRGIVRLHASSGTTGSPTVVGYTRRDLAIWLEMIARCLSAFGTDCNDIVSVAYGYGLFTGGLGLHYGVEHLGATVIPMSSGNTAKHIKLIHDFGATAITCTPSYALYLAEAMAQAGIPREEFAENRYLRGRTVDREHAPRDRNQNGSKCVQYLRTKRSHGAGGVARMRLQERVAHYRRSFFARDHLARYAGTAAVRRAGGVGFHDADQRRGCRCCATGPKTSVR